MITSEYEPVDVAIVCESTYPYMRGGLSAVVHQICEGAPDLKIGIIHITWDADSPSDDLYGMPKNVQWVMPVYQSMIEHRQGFQMLQPSDAARTWLGRGQLTKRLMAAVDAHLAGDDNPLWSLYDDGINPLTRKFNLFGLLGSCQFMDAVVPRFGSECSSLTDVFWRLRDFASLAYSVLSPVFPNAQVYHAHTNGAAALLAAAAARQHGTSYVLTEHNLYTRDTINYMIKRPMDLPVTANDWHALGEYETVDGSKRTPSAHDRAWMRWFTATGVLAYRAADRISYLYPEAIAEAAELGGIPTKSLVIANGLDVQPFLAQRVRFHSRTEQRRNPDYIWRFVYIGRVVRIKGLKDLLHSLDLVRKSGFSNFTLDVCGPDGEDPQYVRECRELADNLGLTEFVRFRGSVNLRAELGDFDALLMPSHNEGLPIALLEAMAVGLPSLVTDVGGNLSVVAAPRISDQTSEPIEAAGVVTEPRDIPAMATAILETTSDVDRFDWMSRNAIWRIDALYSIKSVINEYCALYGDLGCEAARQIVEQARTTPSRGRHRSPRRGVAVESGSPKTVHGEVPQLVNA